MSTCSRFKRRNFISATDIGISPDSTISRGTHSDLAVKTPVGDAPSTCVGARDDAAIWPDRKGRGLFSHSPADGLSSGASASSYLSVGVDLPEQAFWRHALDDRC
jgi:hypothetical protein